MFTQEFSDISLANNIIEQIANVKNTTNAIATKINERENTILYSLEKLISVGLMKTKTIILY